MEPLPSNNEYPRFGRSTLDQTHAPYAIVMQLQQLGLSEWAGTVLSWLGRYDGLEEHLHIDSNQATTMRDALMRFAIETPKPEAGTTLAPQALRELKAAIVEDLLQLDFVRTIAYWGPLFEKRIVWNPLEMSWLGFLDILPISDDREGEECLMVITKEEADPAHLQAIHDLLMSGPAPENSTDTGPGPAPLPQAPPSPHVPHVPHVPRAPQPGRASDGQADH